MYRELVRRVSILNAFRLTYLPAQSKPNFRPRSSHLNPHSFTGTLSAMARTTRASAANEKQNDPAPPPTRGKTAAVASKKRKRGSVAEIEDQPSAKQLRSGDSSIKDEEVSDAQPTDQLPILQNAGDVPINSDDAQKILDILEMYAIHIVDSPRNILSTALYRIDTQGLLDRVFPLHSNSAEASGSQPTSYSFRNLLRESSRHTLFTLRVRFCYVP